MDPVLRRLLLESARLHHLDDEPAVQALEREALDSGCERMINTLGYSYLFQHNALERAIAMFRRNVSEFPASWNAHDSLGEALVLAGRLGEALDCYELARQMAPEPHRSRIAHLLDRLQALN